MTGGWRSTGWRPPRRFRPTTRRSPGVTLTSAVVWHRATPNTLTQRTRGRGRPALDRHNPLAGGARMVALGWPANHPPIAPPTAVIIYDDPGRLAHQNAPLAGARAAYSPISGFTPTSTGMVTPPDPLPRGRGLIMDKAGQPCRSQRSLAASAKPGGMPATWLQPPRLHLPATRFCRRLGRPPNRYAQDINRAASRETRPVG